MKEKGRELQLNENEQEISKTNGIKTQDNLIGVPELCQLCECKSKDENAENDLNFYYCEFLEGDFKPNILCFTPKIDKEYPQLRDIALDFSNQLEELTLSLDEVFYKDVRKIVEYTEKITQLCKDVIDQYTQSVLDFKHFLNENNLKVNEKYFFPA